MAPTPPPHEQWAGTALNAEQRGILSRLGICTVGEAYMMGDPNNLPILSQLPLTPCLPHVISLRPGQVWKHNDLIWEILAINLDCAQVIFWEPSPSDPTILYIDENNFCMGSGSLLELPKSFILGLPEGSLLTLDIEQHRRNGNSYSRILFQRPRSLAWPTPPHTNLNESLISLLQSPLPTRTRDMYTDGSWTLTGSTAHRIISDGTKLASGAVVLEDVSEWGPIIYHGIKITGDLENPKSAYIYELLAITLAAALSAST